MSAAVRLSSKMPGDPETNGVDSLRTRLVDEPEDLRVALVWFDVARVTIDTDTDEHVPTIRIRRIEPLGTIEDVDPVVREVVQDAVAARTGRRPIPFGIVEAEDYAEDEELPLEPSKDDPPWT